jgi:hypothetical protein
MGGLVECDHEGRSSNKMMPAKTIAATSCKPLSACVGAFCDSMAPHKRKRLRAKTRTSKIVKIVHNCDLHC